MILKPACQPYYIDENGKRIKKAVTQGIAYTSDGFLLPCCWLDRERGEKDTVPMGLRDESLRLENNDSIEEILLSQQWQNFIDVLYGDPKNAPTVCKRNCKSIK